MNFLNLGVKGLTGLLAAVFVVAAPQTAVKRDQGSDACELIFCVDLLFIPKAPQNPRRLACRYFRQHPVCTIKRCPVEVVFTDPDIMILHQVMSDSEVERVRQISEPIVRVTT